MIRLPRTGAVALFWLVLPVTPLAAQVSGTWRLLLHEATGTVRGRLVLAEQAGAISGQLLLETSDSAPVRVTGQIGPERRVELRVAAPKRLALSGVLEGDRLTGTVEGPGGREDWSAERLTTGVEYYPAPPRFRAREIVLDEPAGLARLAGVGSAAASAAGDSIGGIVTDYRARSVAAGMAPLDDSGLRRDDLLFAMGLFRREEVIEASTTVLQSIRDALPSDTTRARFDYLFRPRGRWIVDLHGAARERVVQKFPALTWEALGPIATIPEVLRQDLPPGADAVPFGLYRLYILSMTEPDVFTLRLEELRRADPTVAEGVERYVQAYTEAAEWYRSVIQFFLSEPWLDGRSLTSLVTATWPWPEEVTPPAVRTRGYGYPDGSPRVMPAPETLARLVVPENWAAREWLARHGEGALLAALGGLPREPANTVFAEGAGSWLVTSVAQRREEASTGFLEPENAVLIDPSYVPLLALGMVVHEWFHILHERRRVPITLTVTADGDTIARFRPPALLPAEGLAEWLADIGMEPAVARYPLLGVGEAAKRATMAITRPTDPHLAGFRIVRSLAQVLQDRTAVVTLLIAAVNDPDTILRHPAVARAWAPFRGGTTTLVEMNVPRWLVPETTFVIDDGAVFARHRRLLPPAP